MTTMILIYNSTIIESAIKHQLQYKPVYLILSLFFFIQAWIISSHVDTIIGKSWHSKRIMWQCYWTNQISAIQLKSAKLNLIDTVEMFIYKYMIPDIFTGIGLTYTWLYFHDAYWPNHMSKEMSSFHVIVVSFCDDIVTHCFTDLGLKCTWLYFCDACCPNHVSKESIHDYCLLDALHVIFRPRGY